MIPNAGRKVLVWASVFLTGYFAYALFDLVYVNWLVWQGGLPYGGAGFWDVQLGFVPILAGATLALAAAVTMLLWNLRSPNRPTTEVTYLLWVGLGVMAFFGSQLVHALAYLAAGFTPGGWSFETWLQPAVPFVIGLVMVLTALGKSVSRKQPGTVPAAD